MVKGPVTEEVPASVPQNHPDVTLIPDEAAAARIIILSFEKQSYETQVEAFGAQPFSLLKSYFQTNQLPSPL